MTRRETGWRWKVAARDQNPELDLRYEPGHWGDVLKGAWACVLARELARPDRPLALLDPFAGAPDWPLTEAAAERLAPLAELPGVVEQQPFLEVGRFASTARLVTTCCPTRPSVFDRDPARRGRWDRADDAAVLAVEDGAQALTRHAAAAELVLVDPYDLFEEWSRLVPPALGAPPAAAVLFYLFNKAPRGAGRFAAYRRLRDDLDRRLGDERSLLVGRVPGDAVLPRAWHEVLAVVPRERAPSLREALRGATLPLARHLQEAGSFEG